MSANRKHEPEALNLMAVSFTNWTDFAADLRNKLAKRDLTLSAMTGPDGSSFQYRTVPELERLLAFAERRAAEEATTVAGSRRTYAKASRW